MMRLFQHYGSQVRQEVLSELMGQSYRDAVQQENLNPAAQPQIEPEITGSESTFAYTATFEVLPEFKLSGLDKIEVTVPEIDIQDSDCDDMIWLSNGEIWTSRETFDASASDLPGFEKAKEFNF